MLWPKLLAEVGAETPCLVEQHQVSRSFARIFVRTSRRKGGFGVKEEGGSGEERGGYPQPTPALVGFSPSGLLAFI